MIDAPKRGLEKQGGMVLKNYLVSGCLFAVVVSLSLGSTASANPIVDPDCDGSPNDNSFAVHGFDVTTTSPWANEMSGLTASGVACGTTLNPSYFLGVLTGCSTNDTLNTNFDFKFPPGVEANPTAGIPDGSYAGTASGRVAVSAVVFQQCAVVDGGAVLRVELNDGDDDCPQDAVSCYRVETSLGGGNVWVTGTTQDGFQLRIGPIHAPSGASGGFTQFAFTLCQNVGGSGSDICGDNSQPWLTKNGDATTNDCTDGNGLYEARVQRQSGAWTPWTSDCVTWQTPPDPPSPDCDGTPYGNDYAVHEFGVTTNPTTAGALSDITFNYLICGTALGAGSEGDDTVNDHVDIKQPGDSMIQNTFGIDTGSYAGRLKGRIMYRDGAGDAQVADTEAKLTVEWADLRFLERERWARNASNNWVKTNPIVDNCNRQADPGVSNVEGDNNRLGPDYLAGENIGTFDYQAWVPTDALGRPTTSLASFIPSCFKLVSTSGPFNWYAWAWGTFSVVDGHRHLTVGPIHTDTTPPAPENDDPTASFDDRQVGFTSTSDNRDPFELTICDNAGDVGANVCGSDRDPVLHRNGDGEGCYEIIATNKGADKTAAQAACVNWTGDRTGIFRRTIPTGNNVTVCRTCRLSNEGAIGGSGGGPRSGDSDARDGDAPGSKNNSSGSASHHRTQTRSLT